MNAQTEEKWIKCTKDEMPKSGKKVLLIVEYAEGFRHRKIGFYTKGKDITYDVEDCDLTCEACENNEEHYLEKGWYEEISEHGYCDGAFNSIEKVTHWMPLPELPTEKE